MTKHAEDLAKLGWQYLECPACGSEGARAFPKPEPNKDGSPCPEFWDWLPKAYNFDGNGAFTKYNMEVAFLAGKQASQPAQQEPVVCIIGTRGSAFDSPITKRAYTYKEQPGNAVAFKLGRACNEAGKQRAGDNIDRGLGLLQELQNEGFGVFALGAEYTVTQQEPVACVQDLDEVKRKHLVYEKGMDWKDPLYTSPPAQRTWGRLTNKDIYECEPKTDWYDSVEFAKAIEAKLKELNT